MSFNQTCINNTIDDIQPLLDSFSTLHRIWLKFVGSNGEYIITPKNKSQSEYCRCIRSCPEGLNRCRASVIKCMRLEPHKPHLFPCHAGLFILAIPLHGNTNFIGAFATGEIKISGAFSSSTIKEKVRDLNLDTTRLLRLYKKIPVIKREKAMNLGESLHTISNCLIKLAIKSAVSRRVDQTAKNDIKEEESSMSEDISLKWSYQIVQQASRYIYSNFRKALSLEEVAKHVHLSPTYFSYLFSQVQKQTFSDFLMETRLAKAKELLEQSPGVSISNIARIIGYNDPNYFSRVFKKKVGIPPSTYRMSMN